MPYKHKISSRILDECSTEPLPEPYEWLKGAKILSPRWGNGWLGISGSEDQTVVWHVNEDRTCQPLNFDSVSAIVDPPTGDIWLVFESSALSYLFLLWPEEALGTCRVPSSVRKALGGKEHE